jgi:hypothetical protein
LLGSPEFFSRHGQNNDTGFLPAVYQAVLHRPIDPSGAQSWSAQLAQGVSRQAVAAALLTSLESDQLVVQTAYLQLLHRAAEPGGLNVYRTALQQGLSEEQLVAYLVSSEEYFSQLE